MDGALGCTSPGVPSVMIRFTNLFLSDKAKKALHKLDRLRNLKSEAPRILLQHTNYYRHGTARLERVATVAYSGTTQVTEDAPVGAVPTAR